MSKQIDVNDLFLAVAEMAVQTVNCIYQIDSMMAAQLTPLEEMAAEALPDEDEEEH